MLRERVQMNKQGFMVKKTDDDRTLAYGWGRLATGSLCIRQP